MTTSSLDNSYISHVLAHIADADTVEKLEALLPWNMPTEV